VSFLVLGASVVLAAFVVVAGALSLLVAAAAPFLRRLQSGGARRRAAVLFSACLLPTAGGLLAAFLLVLPAWIAHEPRHTRERPGALLLAVAALGLLLLASAAARVWRDHRRTRRALDGWLRAGEPLESPRPLPLPAWRVEHAFPLAAVAGVRRPRLLVARAVAEALTGDELRAVAAHEAGHVAAGDVPRRLALSACADPLRFSAGRAALERSWEEAAEAAADAFAAGTVPPVHLASALVKIAKLVPAGGRVAAELPALVAGAPIAGRVRALLADDGPAAGRAAGTPLRALAAALALGWVLSWPVVLPAVHQVVEGVVTALGASAR
jgi:Zn-dependent protease with chaperone function